MDVLEGNVEQLIKDTEKRWLQENGVLAVKPEESLTQLIQYARKKYGRMAGGGGDDIDANNYPEYLMNNNIPVGDIKGDVAGAEYQDAINGQVDMQIEDAGGATEFEGSIAEYALPKQVEIVQKYAIKTGGSTNNGEVLSMPTNTIAVPKESDSILEFKEKEINIDTETLDDKDNSGVKKIITMS
jgi:hypothetical protein